MHFQKYVRLLHTSHILRTDMNKNALSTLRKRTGYSFYNCRKALEMHNNNIDMAEKWLQKEAQTLGWSKASKLSERTTSQGLIGVLVRGNIGAMVEVNCESDFVARNQNFTNFVDHVARICTRYAEVQNFDGDLWKTGFEVEALRNLKSSDGKNVADQLALLIGVLGENVTIKRAACFKTNNELQLTGYAHPQTVNVDSTQNITHLGKYGTILAFRSRHFNEELQKNLCQHIIGLNPRKIGEEGIDEPHSNKDNETCLIYQKFLIDEEKTVGEVLIENSLQIIDYQRYECGEVTENEEFIKSKINN